ncbi:MAG TPA: serine/threonine-protein kinase [Pyrinomonadaceae bacterium]|nr:serine/threonine-protein kinase [Pyrinomonadaceae bacterium]
MIAPDTLLQNRYLVMEQIAQGGMGAVYVATDQRFHSTVALKETFFDDPNLRRAFEREAHLLNRLRHPALPKVSDHFLEDNGQFLVMEFIPGKDLAELLVERGTAFPVADVLAWADELLDALDYLHTQEPPIVHRDIKPQNLKLTPRGHIVLLDFGLAKGMSLQLSRVSATASSVFGFSRNYAPLEQIQGAGTDVRSDLYSLSATLYHLMTGATPPDALTRATAVLNAQPDPLRPANEVHGQVPAAVAGVLARAMSQSAAGRPQTASAMRAELRQAARATQAGTSAETHLHAPAASILSEQETQLFGAQATAAPPPSAGTVFAQEEKGEDTPHAAPQAIGETTLVNGAMGAGISAAAASSSSRGTVAVEAAETKLMGARRAQAASAATGGGGWARRLVGVAAGVVLLVVVAVGAYTFARRTAQTTSAPLQPAAGQSNPAPQTNTAATSATPDTAAPAAAQPTSAPSAVTAAPRASTTARNANTRAARKSAGGVTVDSDEILDRTVEDQLRNLNGAFVISPPHVPGGTRQRGHVWHFPPNFNGLSPEEQQRVKDALKKAQDAERDRTLRGLERLRRQRERERERQQQNPEGNQQSQPRPARIRIPPSPPPVNSNN